MAGVWIQLKEKRYRVETGGKGTSPRIDGGAVQAEMQVVAPGVLSLLWTDDSGRTRSFRCIADADSDGAAMLIDGERIPYSVFDPRSLQSVSSGVSGSGPKPLKAPMPGRVIRVLIAAGETVLAGQGCIVIEAMKMQNELKAPRAGVVRALTVAEGETVAAGAVLLVIE